jgi:hypothetical protein
MENQIEIYIIPDGQAHIETKFEGETVWLTQKMMADLFRTTVPNINMHLRNVFDEGELTEEATIKEFLIVRLEGNREVKRSQNSFRRSV